MSEPNGQADVSTTLYACHTKAKVKIKRNIFIYSILCCGIECVTRLLQI